MQRENHICRMLSTLWTVRHFIPLPHGRAMECLNKSSSTHILVMTTVYEFENTSLLPVFYLWLCKCSVGERNVFHTGCDLTMPWSKTHSRLLSICDAFFYSTWPPSFSSRILSNRGGERRWPQNKTGVVQLGIKRLCKNGPVCKKWFQFYWRELVSAKYKNVLENWNTSST